MKDDNQTLLYIGGGALLVTLFGIAINYSILLLFSNVFGVHYLLSNLIGIVCATLSNYIFSSRWAWKNE